MRAFAFGTAPSPGPAGLGNLPWPGRPLHESLVEQPVWVGGCFIRSGGRVRGLTAEPGAPAGAVPRWAPGPQPAA